MTLTTKNRISIFSLQQLEGIAKILADTSEGLKGSEIGDILLNAGIPDPTPEMTKWKRLTNAFISFQNEHQVGNHVVVFIQRSMDPASDTSAPQVFEKRKRQLNAVLSLCGLEVKDSGRIRSVPKASSLNEAVERADQLRSELKRRNVHSDVIKFCDAELIAQNYFHAVLEAMKSITSKIRKHSGLTSDGAELADQAFSLGKSNKPVMAINPLKTDTQKGEQRSFVSLLKGLYGVVRNPLAHEAKIEWEMTEQDALDTMTMISLIHRKLDSARKCEI